MRISNRVVAVVTGVLCFLIFGAMFAGDVAALCGYAEVTCTFPKKLRPDLHPDHVVVINDGTSNVATFTLTGNGTVTMTLTATGGTSTWTHTHAVTDIVGAAPSTHTHTLTEIGGGGKVAVAEGDGINWLNQKITGGDGLYVSTAGSPPNQSVKVSMQSPALQPVEYVFAPGLQMMLGTFDYLGNGIYERNVVGAVTGTTYVEAGITVQVYDRIGVLAAENENYASSGRPQNGIYTVLEPGDATHKFQMQRAGDLDEIAEFKEGSSFYVTRGDLYGGMRVQFRYTGAATLETDDLHFLYYPTYVTNADVIMIPDSEDNLFSDSAPGFCPQYAHTMGQTKVLTEEGWARIGAYHMDFSTGEQSDAMPTTGHPGLVKTLPDPPTGSLYADNGDWADPTLSVASGHGYWEYTTVTGTGTSTTTATATATSVRVGLAPILHLSTGSLSIVASRVALDNHDEAVFYFDEAAGSTTWVNSGDSAGDLTTYSTSAQCVAKTAGLRASTGVYSNTSCQIRSATSKWEYQAFTVHFWLMLLGPTSGNTYFVFKNYNTGNTYSDPYYSFTVAATGAHILKSTGPSTYVSTNQPALPALGMIPIGEWVHIAVSWDGVALIYYINAIEVARSSDQSEFSIPYGSHGEWSIGMRPSGTSNTAFVMQDLRIADVARSSTYLQDLVRRGHTIQPNNVVF